ncbi:UPF0161 protein At3g09310-like [Vicia villosa]|uniref:UPF0161 protein At3g09310-like n=1 Tax=Vicia villosa TaxID=3911 RepID=UPI00273C51C2|nr:UPF0161 protein At3g09310-like [Vicia villosa]XP_058764103.1 UPF0161 protein At3g09310-like [Vicia villosa]XP_058764104.1 UPF0161 protein At3g09310-like [Vicia villosa]
MATVVFPLILNTSTTPSQFTFQSNKIPNPNFTSLNFNFNKPLSSRSTPSLRATHNDSNNHETLQDAEVDNLGVKAALSILRFYKREISPILPRSCRYVPTCSEYSMEAYKRYGVLKGTTLTVCRLCRCNPLGGSGFDPPRWFGEIRQGEELDD